jgi:hypothetical protein
MTVKFDNTETAICHLEAFLNGGDELGDVPEADAVAALAYLRAVLAPATDARLAEIEARAEAATCGEWHVFDTGILSSSTWVVSNLEKPIENLNDADFIAHAHADIPYLLAELKRLRSPQPVTAPVTTAVAEAGLEPCPYCGKNAVYTTPSGAPMKPGAITHWCACPHHDHITVFDVSEWQSRPLEDALRQELAALQEQYRAAMGNYVARKFDIAEARREADVLRLAIRSMEKANEVRVRSVVRENYIRVQSLEAGLRRLLRDLDRAGITKAFDMSIFDYLNDSLNEAALLVQEENGENK